MCFIIKFWFPLPVAWFLSYNYYVLDEDCGIPSALALDIA